MNDLLSAHTQAIRLSHRRPFAASVGVDAGVDEDDAGDQGRGTGWRMTGPESGCTIATSSSTTRPG